ncbi:endonuclease domain-containing protein [Thiovibrio sp. JS02]
MKHLARTLRKKQTEAEKRLWSRLRNRQLAGYKFRRQFPIGPYVVDFACLSHSLLIEVDGEQHAGAVAYDHTRSRFLEQEGYTVLRFWNNEALAETEAVLQRIYEELAEVRESTL